MTNLARELKKLEFRVKTVSRYVVTKYEEWGDAEGAPSQSSIAKHSAECGTFDNPDMAWEVGYALCKERHHLIGWPPGDERIRYPEHPTQKGAARQSEGGYTPAEQQSIIDRVIAANAAERARAAKGVPAEELLRGSYMVYEDSDPVVITPPPGYVLLTKAEHDALLAKVGPHGVTAGMCDAGVPALYKTQQLNDDAAAVTAIYMAMERARVTQQADATLMATGKPPA